MRERARTALFLKQNREKPPAQTDEDSVIVWETAIIAETNRLLECASDQLVVQTDRHRQTQTDR